jgi:hypothetical protein
MSLTLVACGRPRRSRRSRIFDFDVVRNANGYFTLA